MQADRHNAGPCAACSKRLVAQVRQLLLPGSSHVAQLLSQFRQVKVRASGYLPAGQVGRQDEGPGEDWRKVPEDLQVRQWVSP